MNLIAPLALLHIAYCLFVSSSLRLYLQRDTFYRLYSFYCQNIPRSDRLRETLVDTHLFLQECQKRLGHKLPLGAYLLKPVQRITKYKLLLENLLSSSDSGSCTKELQKALDCMLIVLRCVNDSMHQVAITGFPVSKHTRLPIWIWYKNCWVSYQFIEQSFATRRTAAAGSFSSVDRVEKGFAPTQKATTTTHISLPKIDDFLQEDLKARPQ